MSKTAFDIKWRDILTAFSDKPCVSERGPYRLWRIPLAQQNWDTFEKAAPPSVSMAVKPGPTIEYIIKKFFKVSPAEVDFCGKEMIKLLARQTHISIVVYPLLGVLGKPSNKSNPKTAPGLLVSKCLFWPCTAFIVVGLAKMHLMHCLAALSHIFSIAFFCSLGISKGFLPIFFVESSSSSKKNVRFIRYPAPLLDRWTCPLCKFLTTTEINHDGATSLHAGLSP